MNKMKGHLLQGNDAMESTSVPRVKEMRLTGYSIRRTRTTFIFSFVLTLAFALDVDAYVKDGLYNLMEFKRAGILDCLKPQFGTYRRRPPFEPPNWEVYKTLDNSTEQIYDTVRRAGESLHIQRLHSKGKPADDEEYAAFVDLVTFEHGGISPSTLQSIENIPGDEVVEQWVQDNPMREWSQNTDRIKPIPRKLDLVRDKKHILLVFGEHGREIMTTELGQFVIEILSQKNLRLALQPIFKGKPGLDRVVRALENVVIHIIPCENRNGREIVEKGEFCLRKNGRGTDPNRNWPLNWGVKAPDYNPLEEYPGVEPLSEPETRLMFRTISAVEPHSSVNVHSGMHGMFLSPDYLPILEKKTKNLALLKLLQRINDIWIDSKCTIGAAGHAVGYVSYGTCADFLRVGFQIPLPQTWEIYGDEKAHYDDCFLMFNPLEYEKLQDYMHRWAGAIFTHIADVHEALAPGLSNTDPYTFKEEVANLPNPLACGLKQEHMQLLMTLNRNATSSERSNIEQRKEAQQPVVIERVKKKTAGNHVQEPDIGKVADNLSNGQIQSKTILPTYFKLLSVILVAYVFYIKVMRKRKNRRRYNNNLNNV